MAGLKPCPFCGIIPTIEYDDYFMKWVISCNNHKCKIQPSTDLHKRKGVITKEWNRRAEDGK